MNLCIRCSHFYRASRGNPTCIRDSTPCPVDGNPSGAIYQCLAERAEAGDCGPDGRRFVSGPRQFSEAVGDSFKRISSPVECRPEVVDGRVCGAIGNSGAHESADQLGMAFSEAITKLTVDFINSLAQQNTGRLAGLPKDSIIN